MPTYAFAISKTKQMTYEIARYSVAYERHFEVEFSQRSTRYKTARVVDERFMHTIRHIEIETSTFPVNDYQ